jgi:hypothetical protein
MNKYCTLYNNNIIIYLLSLIFQHFRGHKSRGSHQTPRPLRSNKLTDSIVGELYQDIGSSIYWNGILGIWKLPYQDIVTLQVTIDNFVVVKILQCTGNLI